MLMFVWAILCLPVPPLIKVLFDEALPGREMTLIYKVSFALLVIAATKSFVGYVKDVSLARYSYSVSKFIRELLFKKIISSRLQFFEENHSGYICSRLDDDVDKLDNMFIESLSNVMLISLTFVSGVSISLYLNPKLTILALVLSAPYAAVYNSSVRKLYELSVNNQEVWGRFKGVLTELISSISIFKSHNQESRAASMYDKAMISAISSNKEIDLCKAKYEATLDTLTSFAPIIVIIIGVIQIAQGEFSIGGLVAFSSNMGSIYGPINGFVTMNANLSAGMASAARVFEILDMPPESDSFGNEEIPNINRIMLSNCSYRYLDGTIGLAQISFSISKGHLVCITGRSGSGKTTIGKLIMGFVFPTEGEILLNDRSINSFKHSSIRSRIGYVPQEPALLSGSILENIQIGNPTATDVDIAEAVDIACLSEWIKTLPNGLNTQVMEKGSGISGGEKQRIAIARALVNRPDFLILDEISSALGNSMEEDLFKKLGTLSWKPGIINITHRVGVIKTFEEVIELS